MWRLFCAVGFFNMFPLTCIKSNSLTSVAINDRHSLGFLCFCGLTSFQVQQFTISVMSSHLLLSSPPLFVCSDQLTGIDVAAETIRWPPVKQRTGGWLACQQRCGHTALWRQRYKLHYTQTGFFKTWKRIKPAIFETLNDSLSAIKIWPQNNPKQQLFKKKLVTIAVLLSCRAEYFSIFQKQYIVPSREKKGVEWC